MENKKPFEGIKVAEFAWVAVGPQSTKYLADHGATVVRIESHNHFDLFRGTSPFPDNIPGLNRSMFYGKYNSNKYNISLDLNHPEGRKLVWRLIEWADIVIESYRPGTMKKWGLDYEAVSKVNPEIIYLSTSMQGQTGPFSKYAGVGSMISAVAGMGAISGWPDRMPSPSYGAYSDYFCQRFNAAALVAALDYRRRTGKGQWIEQSQLEGSVYFISPVIMDYFVNGTVAGRDGNRSPLFAPHGVYPCQGDDCWVAIAVQNDRQWEQFCTVTGNTEWTAMSELGTLSGRKQNEDRLDRMIGEWTSQYTAEAVEVMLQDAGIPASVVEKSSDLFNDEQLKHRNFYTWLEHPEIGKAAFQQQANFILSKTPREISEPSPCLGEDNEYVYHELLEMTWDEISDRLADGSITTGLPDGFTFTTNM